MKDILFIGGTALLLIAFGWLLHALKVRLTATTPPPLDLPREGYRPRFLQRI